MLLNKPIGVSTPEEPAISGDVFASEIYDWKGQGKDVTVKINSLGGNVYRGWDIVDSIIETKAKTENVGFAYSMAGIALIVGSDRVAYPHSRAMIHAPRTEDGKKNYHTELIKDQFRSILKNHTKFTEAEINEMIDSGKNYFFDAKQQLEKGMVDRIADTGGYNNDVMKLSEKEVYSYINKQLETETDNDMDVKDFIAKLFPGKSDAESMVNAVQMKTENETLKAENAKHDAELKAVKAELEALKAEQGKGEAKSKGAELIEKAIKEGKFPNLKPEDKAKLVDNATANYDGTKAMIDLMVVSKTVAAATIPAAEKAAGELTYKWLVKNNPEELNRIATEDPELFEKLSAQFVESEKEGEKK